MRHGSSCGCPDCEDFHPNRFDKPVSPNAAEAPGGQDARELIIKIHEICDDYTAAPTLSKHTGLGVVTIVEDLCQKYLAAPTAPSERARFVEWYAKWPKGRPTSDGLTVPEIIEAAEAYAEYVSGATSSLSEERKRFKKWAAPKPWYTPAIFAYGEKEGEFADALVQEFWECWRAGLSSQEGK